MSILLLIQFYEGYKITKSMFFNNDEIHLLLIFTTIFYIFIRLEQHLPLNLLHCNLMNRKTKVKKSTTKHYTRCLNASHTILPLHPNFIHQEHCSHYSFASVLLFHHHTNNKSTNHDCDYIQRITKYCGDLSELLSVKKVF